MESGSILLAKDTDEMIQSLIEPKAKLYPSLQPDLHGPGLVRRQLKALTSAEQDPLQAEELWGDMNQGRIFYLQ